MFNLQWHNIFSFRKRSLRFVSNIHHAIIRWVVVNCEEFGCLLGRGREIWNWIWVEFGINGRFMKYFFKNCLGTPCYLIVVSGGFFFLNKDTRRCFLRCLQVSSNSQLEMTKYIHLQNMTFFWYFYGDTFAIWNPNIQMQKEIHIKGHFFHFCKWKFLPFKVLP